MWVSDELVVAWSTAMEDRTLRLALSCA